MKTGYTHIAVVLDRSGSMASCADDTKGGFDTFVKEQRAIPGSATLTLAQFDDIYEVVHDFKDLQDVTPLVFIPRGQTALLDAIGKTIASTGERLAALTEGHRPEHVIFVILTDGAENASKEFKRDEIMKMIQHQQDAYQWKFVFLGANQDAIQSGGNIGIMAASSLTYNQNNTRQAYSTVSHAMSALRTGEAHSMAFMADDRKKNAPKTP